MCLVHSHHSGTGFLTFYPTPYMKLINHTTWKSEDLSNLFKEGLKAKGVDHKEYIVAASPSQAKRDIEESRARGAEHWVGEDGKALHGYAYLSPMYSVSIYGKRVRCHGKRFIRMFLPEGKFDMKKFAQIFEHEVDHTLGLRHKDMMDSDLLNPKWHEGFPLSV